MFDYDSRQFQYETINLGVLLDIGKRDYMKVLLGVLRELYDEEGLGSEITTAVRRAFRFTAVLTRFHGSSAC